MHQTIKSGAADLLMLHLLLHRHTIETFAHATPDGLIIYLRAPLWSSPATKMYNRPVLDMYIQLCVCVCVYLTLTIHISCLILYIYHIYYICSTTAHTCVHIKFSRAKIYDGAHFTHAPKKFANKLCQQRTRDRTKYTNNIWTSDYIQTDTRNAIHACMYVRYKIHWTFHHHHQCIKDVNRKGLPRTTSKRAPIRKRLNKTNEKNQHKTGGKEIVFKVIERYFFFKFIKEKRKIIYKCAKPPRREK